MTLYRKKPVVISAEQWQPGKYIEGVVEMIYDIGDGVMRSGGFGHIQTLEGNMRVYPGDWIITGVKNEKYPCKDEIFRATYEPVD